GRAGGVRGERRGGGGGGGGGGGAGARGGAGPHHGRERLFSRSPADNLAEQVELRGNTESSRTEIYRETLSCRIVPEGVCHGQRDSVGARSFKGMLRVLHCRNTSVTKVPGPGSRGIGGGVREVHGTLTSLTSRRNFEGSDGRIVQSSSRRWKSKIL